MTSYEIIHALAGINSHIEPLDKALSEQEFEHFEAKEITEAVEETLRLVDRLFTKASFQVLYGSPKRALERFDGVQK